jgi:hypothetical protein
VRTLRCVFPFDPQIPGTTIARFTSAHTQTGASLTWVVFVIRIEAEPWRARA